MKKVIFLIFLHIISKQSDASMVEIGEKLNNKPVVVELNKGKLALRYRLQTDEFGDLSHNTLQDQVLFDISIGFLQNQVKINFTLASGGKFTGGWGDLGLGSHDPALEIYLKRLTLTLNPTEGLSLSVGSMAPEYGAGSENSYFDKDGSIMGYRAKVAIHNGELVVTGGFVGDYENPNVFNRMHYLGEVNYVQMILTQAIGEIVKASVDYTNHDQTNYLRAAVQFKVDKWVNFLDSITLEDLVALSRDDLKNVFAVKLSKKFKSLIAGKDLKAGLVYAFNPNDIEMLIGDKIVDGHSIRVQLAIPNIIKTKSASYGVFFDVLESLTDLRQVRAELGLMIKF